MTLMGQKHQFFSTVKYSFNVETLIKFHYLMFGLVLNKSTKLRQSVLLLSLYFIQNIGISLNQRRPKQKEHNEK